ncbi:MAG: histidinol-phosphate transaminase [Rikenellaceae bacterium]
MKNILSKVRKNILNLAPYSTARDEYQGTFGIYLDANESPYENGFNRYPDPYQKELKARVSEIKNIDERNIFIGNGSDEPIDLAYRVFCEPGVDNVVAIAPSYGMYKVAAEINNIECREVVLEEDFSLCADKLLAKVDEQTKIIWLCSPNNPTGNSLCDNEITKILDCFNGVVVIDEAYIDFSSKSSYLSKLLCNENLIVLQTLSKAWGMAGLRLGLAFASEAIVEIFTRVKYPYNINTLTQATVIKQLDVDIKPQIDEIIAQREWLVERMQGIKMIEKITPSDANFLLVKVKGATELYNELIEAGVIVRDRSRVVGCADSLRISVGTPEENKKLIQILENARS